MRGTTRTVAVAGISAAALLLAGCGGGGEEETPDATAQSGGDISVEGCTPQNPLIPSNTSETCGGNVLDLVTAKLVSYATKDAKPEMDIAESITTSDNQNFEVKLKKGYKFHDGTEVKSKNFVDAWNYATYFPNGQGASYFFTPFEGYADLQSVDPDDDGPQKAPEPKAKEMSGLKVVDDYTFTIKTSEKVSNLPVRLGYTAFAPLPDSFFADPEAYGKKPIGAGPYEFVSLTPDVDIKLKKFADYTGKSANKPDSITFKIYADDETAYKDLIAGTIDVMEQVPTSALIGEQWKTDLQDRAATKAVAGITHVGFTKSDPRLANVKVRSAISMAINRQEITDKIFNKGRVPATGWVPPGIDGYAAGACGESCTFDAAKAKTTLAEGGGFTGTLEFAYNNDGGHKEWVEATCNQIKTNTGINCVPRPFVDFSTMLKELESRKFNGLFRLGWQMDYPSIENFLAPIYGTNADSNYQDYSSPTFDKLLADAAADGDPASSNSKYQEAEKVLGADLPTMPMWYTARQTGWSDKVNTVEVDAFGVPDYGNVTLK